MTSRPDPDDTTPGTRRVFSFTGTEEEARELAKLLNDERRHLTREDRAEWVRKLRERGLSTRAIADAVGMSDTTVFRDLKSGASHEAPPIVEGEGDDVRGSCGGGGPVVPAGDAPDSVPASHPKVIQVSHLPRTRNP
jgi:hypothetical protein